MVYDDAKAVDNGRIGPFAVHNSTVYFILQRLEQPDFRTKLNIIELRRMRASCRDGSTVEVPVTASSSYFDLLECSDVIGDVISEAYATERKTYTPLDNLLLIR